jgi:hypothetical protein
LAATPTVSRDSRAAHWCEHCHHTPAALSCAPWDVVHSHSSGTMTTCQLCFSRADNTVQSTSLSAALSGRVGPCSVSRYATSPVASAVHANPATPLHRDASGPSPSLPVPYPTMPDCSHFASSTSRARSPPPRAPPRPFPDQSNPTEHLPLLALADVLRGWVGGGVWCRVYDCEVPLAKARYHWSRPLRSLSCVRWWRPTRVWRRTGSSSPPASRPCRCRCALSARSLALHLTARCVLGAGNAHKATTRPCTHASSSTEGAQRHSTHS